MERILSITMLSFFIVTPVLAAPAAANASKADATRLYVGAQLGDSVVGGMLGLQINRAYSLEVRYDYIDTVYEPNTTTKASRTSVAGIGMYPLKIADIDSLFIFGKAGYERTTTKTTANDPGIPGFFPATTTITTTARKRVIVGAGVQYDFSRDVSGRIGMNAVGSDHSVYLTAIYKF
jgi:hypothetical protein